jgi:serine/threonine-protein kinase
VSFQAGALIGGRYRLDGLIGSGGMGEVFRAHDIVLARDVAVKLVEAVDPRRRDEITRSFLREARISAALAHRNVVQILDFGTHDGTIPFMVMELLKGESLADILGRGEALSFEWILTIASEVLDGLSVAHEQGVVHRDLKPENIFLAETASGVHPKVLDFGISKILDASGSATITTTQGHVVGTPAYMSPEQARGIKVIDKRTDVYSMGVVLYELLSGEMPFFSENPGDLLIMIITEEAVPLVELIPDVGAEVSAIVERAMAKDPDARFADAPALQRALLSAADRLLGTEASRRLGERARPPSWRKRATTFGHADSDALTIVGRMSTSPPRPVVRSPVPVPRKRAQPSRFRGYAIAAAAAFLAGAIGGAAIWLGRSNAASSSPRVIVVSADSAEPSASPNVRQEAESAREAPAEAPATQDPAAEAGLAPEKSTRSQSSGPRDTASELAESFRKQKGDVVLCVNEHVDVVEHTPKLGVRFTLSADGAVVQAEVSPAGVATTPLGTCIRKAAQAMHFPKQAAPISFEVPLTARKGS